MSVVKVDIERCAPDDRMPEAESGHPAPELELLPRHHRLAVWIAAALLPWAAIALLVVGVISLVK